MYSLSARDPHVIGTLTASALGAAGVVAYLVFRRRPTPEEIERDRRAELVRSGRIIDGTILDVSDLSGSDEMQEGVAPEVRFIVYKYEIGGVEYECSQDVDNLRDYFNADDLRLSFPCSVRYDVHRPENSIIIAENWSGLRMTARSVPMRHAARPRDPRPSTPASR